MSWQYLHDPELIEQRSFAQIRQLSDLSRFDDEQAQVAMRLIHTAGDPSLVQDLHFSPTALPAGLAAIHDPQRPLLCDVEMVRYGLTRRWLYERAHCFLDHPQVPALAKSRGETRSMAALEFWPPLLAGSIVVIGNAPTALFRLLELLQQGTPAPALIVGMPVGFIGAAESKQALTEYVGSVPWITVHGWRGGSALAAATVNALARLARGIRF